MPAKVWRGNQVGRECRPGDPRAIYQFRKLLHGSVTEVVEAKEPGLVVKVVSERLAREPVLFLRGFS